MITRTSPRPHIHCCGQWGWAEGEAGLLQLYLQKYFVNPLILYLYFVCMSNCMYTKTLCRSVVLYFYLYFVLLQLNLYKNALSIRSFCICIFHWSNCTLRVSQKKFQIEFLDEPSFALLLHWTHWYVQSSNCAKLGSSQNYIRNFFWDTLYTKTPCPVIFFINIYKGIRDPVVKDFYQIETWISSFILHRVFGSLELYRVFQYCK